jgi:zinc and cadmium transporter
MQIWLYTILSVVLVSLVSLVGVVSIFFSEKKISSALRLFVSFSVGSLLGDAFIHLIPEAFSQGELISSFAVLAGIMTFFVLERFIHWRHCHKAGCEEHGHALPAVILFGDGLHNFIDGIIIGASYLVSVPVGIATTLAVIFHEIPQEIGDFGTLLYAGFSKGKALLWNFISALTAVVGAIMVLLISSQFESVTKFLVPFAAGGFIYIATADMIPELHKHQNHKLSETVKQVFFFVLGIAVMYGLLIFE